MYSTVVILQTWRLVSKGSVESREQSGLFSLKPNDFQGLQLRGFNVKKKKKTPLLESKKLFNVNVYTVFWVKTNVHTPQRQSWVSAQETSDLWTHTHTMEKKTIWSRYVHFLFFLSHNVNREVNTEPSSKSLLFWSTPCVHKECDIWTWLSHNNRVQLSWVSQSFRIYKKTFQPLYAVDIPLYCKSWYWITEKHNK